MWKGLTNFMMSRLMNWRLYRTQTSTALIFWWPGLQVRARLGCVGRTKGLVQGTRSDAPNTIASNQAMNETHRRTFDPANKNFFLSTRKVTILFYPREEDGSHRPCTLWGFWTFLIMPRCHRYNQLWSLIQGVRTKFTLRWRHKQSHKTHKLKMGFGSTTVCTETISIHFLAPWKVNFIISFFTFVTQHFGVQSGSV